MRDRRVNLEHCLSDQGPDIEQIWKRQESLAQDVGLSNKRDLLLRSRSWEHGLRVGEHVLFREVPLGYWLERSGIRKWFCKRQDEVSCAWRLIANLIQFIFRPDNQESVAYGEPEDLDHFEEPEDSEELEQLYFVHQAETDL